MGNKGKVFLIYPPSPVLNREDRCQQPTEDLLVIPPLPPTDLMYLAAIAESCGFEAKIKDYSQGGDFIKELKEFQPHFLVVNIATPTFISDMDWVRKAKEALPGLCTIVKGAPFLTYNANAIYENTFLDYVIIGEAEFTLRDILNGVPNNEILGICYRENFQAEKTEKRPFIENLDSLPFPARHLVNNSIYTRPDNGKVQAVIKVARGCPFHCFFCLLFCRKPADHAPALRIQPHICLVVRSLSDCLSCLCKSADETVFIPAELIDHIPLLFLFFFQICNIICIAFILRKFLQNCHCIIKLHRNK